LRSLRFLLVYLYPVVAFPLFRLFVDWGLFSKIGSRHVENC
jgi:hypothetical protein